MQAVKDLAIILNAIAFFSIGVVFIGLVYNKDFYKEELYKLRYELTKKQLDACMNIDMKEE